MKNRDLLLDMGYDKSIVFENPDYDEAIIGVSDNGRVIYDYDLMIQHLIEKHDMDVDEAADFISYNSSFSSYVDQYPIIMYRLIE